MYVVGSKVPGTNSSADDSRHGQFVKMLMRHSKYNVIYIYNLSCRSYTVTYKFYTTCGWIIKSKLVVETRANHINISS
jgi:hypothetical protein